jgi:hypothetical protein
VRSVCVSSELYKVGEEHLLATVGPLDLAAAALNWAGRAAAERSSLNFSTCVGFSSVADFAAALDLADAVLVSLAGGKVASMGVAGAVVGDAAVAGLSVCICSFFLSAHNSAFFWSRARFSSSARFCFSSSSRFLSSRDRLLDLETGLTSAEGVAELELRRPPLRRP